MRTWLVSACLAALAATAPRPALAQTQTQTGAVHVNAHTEIAAALYAASATQEAAERVYEARLSEQA